MSPISLLLPIGSQGRPKVMRRSAPLAVERATLGEVGVREAEFCPGTTASRLPLAGGLECLLTSSVLWFKDLSPF